MMKLINISKRFGQTAALADIDLEVSGGETVALVGPSGCGKSTLLRLVIGLGEPSRGRVELDGQPIDTRRPTELSRWRRQMGYVIQEGGLFPHLTCRANVSLQCRYFGWDEARIEERVEELRQLVHLAPEVLDRFPRQLSGGQRQRVSLMRALMMDPRVLLLDEPLGALDPMIRAELQRDLRTIFKSLGKTVLLVTHDLREARYLGDRLVLLEDGRIVQQGTYDDLARRPATPFVRRFFAAQTAMDPVAAP